MKEELDERNLDRMVDGELSDEEQSRLLAACEDDPAQWRSLALAYVEAQTWRADFLKIRDEVQESQPKATPASHARHRGLPIQRLLSVAAMLMLSLTIGFGVGALSFTHPANDTSTQLASQPPEGKRSDVDDEIVVLVQNQQTSELQPMKVPFVDISDLHTELDSHSQIPADLWRSLQEEGHDVSHRRQWYSVRLNDGRRALLPIDSVRVMFEGFQ